MNTNFSHRLWTPEQRLEIIDRLASYGYLKQDPYFYLIINKLVTASSDHLNNNTEIQRIFFDAADLLFNRLK